MMGTAAAQKTGTLVVQERGRVLAAIPCFNEEGAIREVVTRALPHVTHVLVVDDGSQDRTAEVAEAAGATVLRMPRNLGKGRALQASFQYARDHGFDLLVVLDGDGQHDPEEIPQLLAPLRSRSADVALGFRFGSGTEMPMWRRVGKRALDYATALFGGGSVTDSQCGYRAFNARAIAVLADRLEAKGFGTESEQLVHIHQNRLSFRNVPISCRYEGIDGSTKDPISHAIGVLVSIVTVAARERPGRTLIVPGLALGLAGVALWLWMAPLGLAAGGVGIAFIAAGVWQWRSRRTGA